jgi:hypothetical protein
MNHRRLDQDKPTQRRHKDGAKIVPVPFDIHGKYGHGCKYEDPWKMYSSIIGMLGFVDNNNITNNGEEWETVQDIIVRTQQDAQLWNDRL